MSTPCRSARLDYLESEIMYWKEQIAPPAPPTKSEDYLPCPEDRMMVYRVRKPLYHSPSDAPEMAALLEKQKNDPFCKEYLPSKMESLFKKNVIKQKELSMRFRKFYREWQKIVDADEAKASSSSFKPQSDMVRSEEELRQVMLSLSPSNEDPWRKNVIPSPPTMTTCLPETLAPLKYKNRNLLVKKATFPLCDGCEYCRPPKAKIPHSHWTTRTLPDESPLLILPPSNQELSHKILKTGQTSTLRTLPSCRPSTLGEPSRISWTLEEEKIFIDKFLAFPKNFGLISQSIPDKSTNDCVIFYYRNKKRLNLKNLHR